MPGKEKPGPEAIVREVRRKTRRRYSAEEKIRIVLEGLRGEKPTKTLAHQVAGSIGTPRACSIMARSPRDPTQRPDIRLQSDLTATHFQL